jgi:hypothetical protein
MEHTSAGGNSFTLAYSGPSGLPFKVGDKVKCVDDRLVACQVVKDTVYHVRDINNTYLYLHEVQGGFYHNRFELVRDGPTPTARANDPATSKGKRRVNKYEQAVLTIMNGGYYEPREQGWTGKELAAESGHPLNCITPRFAPLRRKGLIKDSGTKRDKQTVWVLA